MFVSIPQQVSVLTALTGIDMCSPTNHSEVIAIGTGETATKLPREL